MTPLEKLQELEEAATPRPWIVVHPHDDEMPSWDIIAGTGEDCTAMESEKNAALIPLTRNLLPELMELWRAGNAVGKAYNHLQAILSHDVEGDSLEAGEAQGEMHLAWMEFAATQNALNARAAELMKEGGE